MWHVFKINIWHVFMFLKYIFHMSLCLWNIFVTCFSRRQWRSIGKQIRPFTRYPCCHCMRGPLSRGSRMKNSNYFRKQFAQWGQCSCSSKQMVGSRDNVLSHVLVEKTQKPTKWHPKNWEPFQSGRESAMSKHSGKSKCKCKCKYEYKEKCKCKQLLRQPVAFLGSPPISIKSQKKQSNCKLEIKKLSVEEWTNPAYSISNVPVLFCHISTLPCLYCHVYICTTLKLGFCMNILSMPKQAVNQN